MTAMLLLGLTALAIAAPLGCALAKSLGLWDLPNVARKTQREPALLAGGLVLGLVLVLVHLLAAPFGVDLGSVPANPVDFLIGPSPVGAGPGAGLDPLVRLLGAWPAATALGLALLVGLVDDWLPKGLGPGAKALGQVLAAVPLLAIAPGIWGVLWMLTAVASMNIVNTFDHADRVTPGFGVLATAAWCPPVALGLAGFTLLNRTRTKEQRWPSIYLGDGGSHLLGMLLVLIPGGLVFLLVPALDLTRVVLQRLAVGQSPFHGDRRHVGQVLADAGWSRDAAWSAVTLLSLPAFVFWVSLGTLPLAGGLAVYSLASVGYFLLLRSVGGLRFGR